MDNKKLAELVTIAEKLSPEGRREMWKDTCFFPVFFVYYHSEYVKYAFADFHLDMFGDIDDMLANNIREVAWIIFRESAKTSIAKILVEYLIATKKKEYINIDSFDKANAEAILFDIAGSLSQNPRLVEDYGKLYTKKRSQDEMKISRLGKFLTTNGVMVEAHSTQESVRGRLYEDKRPDFLLLDDFETNKTKESSAYTEQIKSHINEFATGLDSKANILYLGNYISNHGVVQSLMDRGKQDKGLRVRNVPLISQGKLTWKQKYAMTDEEAKATGKVSVEDKRRQVAPSVFSAEFLNDPIDAENQIFKREYFQYRSLEDVTHKNTSRFMTIDTKATDEKNAGVDFIGVCINIVDQENKWNVIARRYKFSTSELINFMFKMWGDWKLDVIGIEQTAFVEGMKNSLEQEMHRRNTFMNITPLSHKGTMKQIRIKNSLESRYSHRQIYHLTVAGENQCADLEEELLVFPKGIHDDVADATAYMDDIAIAPRNALLDAVNTLAVERDMLINQAE